MELETEETETFSLLLSNSKRNITRLEDWWGSFYEREGRPSDASILNSRIIYCLIRPMFPNEDVLIHRLSHQLCHLQAF